MRKNRWALTLRETEVLHMVAGGYEYKEIASRLIVGESTVKKHVGQILIKLNAMNNRHAVAIALRQRLLQVEEIPELTE